ncbi:MAG: type II toxin-antitoxin system VapC family toxin [Bdellovibrio sp.]|nr:type II toxin-antitoxin system VapC family toxin [Bdellovibrio sp.]
MKFWDTSAIVPLFLEEKNSKQAYEILSQDTQMIVWSLTWIECHSVLARLEREKLISFKKFSQAREDLKKLENTWIVVEQLNWVQKRAERLIYLHVLHAADALQLAAALVACEDRPVNMDFVTFDKQLARAAIKEGFCLVIE